jgi:hypothetical protein
MFYPEMPNLWRKVEHSEKPVVAPKKYIIISKRLT